MSDEHSASHASPHPAAVLLALAGRAVRRPLVVALSLLVFGGGPLAAQPLERPSRIRPRDIEPDRWEVDDGLRCARRDHGGRRIAKARICDGPRRVAAPPDPAVARAEALGLGTPEALSVIYAGRPIPDAWRSLLPSPETERMLWPVAGGLFSRGFGRVRRAEIRHRTHDGVDIVAPEGAVIRAAADGLVVYADNRVQGYGNFLALYHGDTLASFYAHCRALYVAPGERVRRGQAIGEVGTTGLAQRAHLHFEVRDRGRPVDPIPRLDERPSAEDLRPEGGDWLPRPPNALGHEPAPP